MPKIEIKGPGGTEEHQGRYNPETRTVTTASGSKVHLTPEDRVTESPDPCFIATAAYGDQDFGNLDLLRVFRDSVLSRHILGRWFIWFYYRVAPWPAQFVARSPGIRRVVRRGLDLTVCLIERATSLRRDSIQKKSQTSQE